MNNFMQDNKFYIGVNYWASHNSINMWSDWDADVVDSDFAKLAAHGVTHLRVFPLWPVFQPLKCIWANMQRYEYRMSPGEQPLPDTEAGRAGVSEEACGHFKKFCDLAEKHGLKLIVGLLTGHMSFRFYWPEAFEGKNFLSDPTVIKWELRFVRYFCKRFANEPAIEAWDLGNEVSCLAGGGVHPDQTYVWTSAIVSAIRESDPSRPVVSGLDHEALSRDNSFNVRDLSELLDIHTTHPYQIFSQTRIDPINSMRGEIDPTVRARLYESLGQKPCFIEEVGSIGYMNCSEKSEADFLRAMLWSAWSEGNHGVFWWCAFDQGHLEYAPYDWNNYGSDYGYFRADGSAKPIAEVSRDFAAFLNGCEVRELPPQPAEAVCIVSRNLTNHYATLGTTYILAKQANINISFAHADDPLPESALYIMPSVDDSKPIFLRRLNELLERVRNGASLYLSVGDTLFRRIPELTGLTIASRERAVPQTIAIDGSEFSFQTGAMYNIESVADTCTVLARNQNGQPVFVQNAYGKGKIFFSLIPFERILGDRAGIFKPGAAPYYKLYKPFASAVDHRAVESGNPSILTTEHALADGRRVIVAVNYANTTQEFAPIFRDGWKPGKLHHGEIGSIPASDAVVFEVTK